MLAYKKEDLTTKFFFKRSNTASLTSQILPYLTYLMLKAPTEMSGLFFILKMFIILLM